MTAVRPPEYFPRLPYAALLLDVDPFVLADTFPFSRQGAHNRARIRAAGGAQWLTVPRRHAGGSVALQATRVVDDGWPRRHLHALRSAYGMAPFYDHVAPELATLLSRDYDSLADLTCATVTWTAQWIGATARLVRASEFPQAPATLADAYEAVGGDALLTLPESAERDRQSLPDVPVRVLAFEEVERRQAFSGFVPDLSVLDLVLNYGPAAGDLLREGRAVNPLL